jgi:hypothetical protein
MIRIHAAILDRFRQLNLKGKCHKTFFSGSIICGLCVFVPLCAPKTPTHDTTQALVATHPGTLYKGLTEAGRGPASTSPPLTAMLNLIQLSKGRVMYSNTFAVTKSSRFFVIDDAEG